MKIKNLKTEKCINRSGPGRGKCINRSCLLSCCHPSLSQQQPRTVPTVTSPAPSPSRRRAAGPQRTEPAAHEEVLRGRNHAQHTVDERHRCWPWEEKDLGVEGCDLFSDLGGGLLRFGQRPDRSWQRGREEKKDRFAGLRFEKRPDRFGREERD